MATVVSLEGKRKAPSLEPLLALCADDMIAGGSRDPGAHAFTGRADPRACQSSGRCRRQAHASAAHGGCRQACGYAESSDRHIKLATCVEFIHSATLLHDDVVDVSALRRGKPSANTVWGDKASVLVGDFLFTRSFELMVDVGSLDILGVLSRASSTIAEGEVLQLVSQRDTSTPEATYLEVIKAKTAKLFAAAAEVGAMVAGRNGPERVALESFGMNLGIAFQLVDDALDYSGREAKLGKTVGDDFREGKITLPVILAFLRGGAVDREFWKRTIEKLDQREGDLEQAQSADRASWRAGRHVGARAPLRRHGARCARPVSRLRRSRLPCSKRSTSPSTAPTERRARAMAGQHILAIDQGTTSTRAIVFDASGRPVASAQKELPQIFPQPGWVEHDPEEIWSATVEVCRGALAKAKLERQGSGRHRHHQSARDHGRVGSRHRQADPQRHRLAGPPHRRSLRGAEAGGAREALHRSHRPAARSLFLRHQDRVDPRIMSPAPALRPRRARSRPAPSNASCCGA